MVSVPAMSKQAAALRQCGGITFYLCYRLFGVDMVYPQRHTEKNKGSPLR